MSRHSFPEPGPRAWIDAVLVGRFTPTIGPVASIAWDVFTETPENTVIKRAWVLPTLSMGPVPAALSILAEKEPRPGEHEVRIRPAWKQTLVEP